MDKQTEQFHTQRCYACGEEMAGRRESYKYSECGLDSVVLKDVIVFRCKCGAVVPEIKNVGLTHFRIAFDLITKPSLLSAKEIRFVRKVTGYSATKLAKVMGVTNEVVSRWENDKCKIDKETDRLLLDVPVSLRRLLSLLDESGEDDYGHLGPSQFAFKTAFLMVLHALSLLGQDVPCAPSVDSEGGIRITWNRFSKQIKLICPPTQDAPMYIYQSSSAGNSLRNQNVTPALLAERLTWLVTREPAGR